MDKYRVAQIVKEQYPFIMTEKQFEEMQEFIKTAKEYRVKNILENESLEELTDRLYRYATPEIIRQVRDYIVGVCIKNTLIGDEEVE